MKISSPWRLACEHASNPRKQSAWVKNLYFSQLSGRGSGCSPRDQWLRLGPLFFLCPGDFVTNVCVLQDADGFVDGKARRGAEEQQEGLHSSQRSLRSRGSTDVVRPKPPIFPLALCNISFCLVLSGPLQPAQNAIVGTLCYELWHPQFQKTRRQQNDVRVDGCEGELNRGCAG